MTREIWSYNTHSLMIEYTTTLEHYTVLVSSLQTLKMGVLKPKSSRSTNAESN